MTTVAPMMTFKYWQGSNVERFKHTDFNRISQMTKTIADMVGVLYTQATMTRSDVFDYGKQNALETAIKQICSKVGISAPMETHWNYGRSVSYVDFDRAEKWLWEAYKALHGEGGRVPWNKDRKFDPFTLFADNWTGTGPYYYSLPTSYGASYDEGLAFVRSEATAGQRLAEYRAMITVQSSSSGVVLQANGVKPKTDIPIIITRGKPSMKETATLSSANWTGTGPWYQTITYSQTVVNGVVTITEGATDAQAVEFTQCGISASAVSGNQVTYRSVLKKPTINLPILLIFENSESI